MEYHPFVLRVHSMPMPLPISHVRIKLDSATHWGAAIHADCRLHKIRSGDSIPNSKLHNLNMFARCTLKNFTEFARKPAGLPLELPLPGAHHCLVEGLASEWIFDGFFGGLFRLFFRRSVKNWHFKNCSFTPGRETVRFTPWIRHKATDPRST